MKKRDLSVALILSVAVSIPLTSCIGSFNLTKNVIAWNNQVGNKFVNEVVFFAFWILPVYEVTSLADLLVLNSIEFWSGTNPVSASTKKIETPQGRYLVECDGKGYDITFEPSGQSWRLDFDADTQTWAFNQDGEVIPFLTFVDDNHVKMITPEGTFRTVELSEAGVLAYQHSLSSNLPLTASL